jgi:lysozyme
MTLQGVPTIGVGVNLLAGITRDESRYLLGNRVVIVIQDLTRRGAPWFSGLDQVRAQVCCDMAYNLGVNGFFGFRKMVGHLSRGEFPEAAREGRSSDWAREVGQRADVLMTMLEAGVE